MKTTKIALILVASVFLAGGCCYRAPQAKNISYRAGQKIYSEELKANVELGYVIGSRGKDSSERDTITNEIFYAAIRESLSAQGLLSDNGRYLLNIKILKLEIPAGGVSIEVTTHVQYLLRDTTNYKIVLCETIVTPHKEEFSRQRIQLATEASGKKNIEAFMEKLVALKI